MDRPGPRRVRLPGGRLTCFLQGLEAPGHPGDAGVEAAAPVVALLGGDLGVAAVHPVLGRDGTLVRRCPKQSDKAESEPLLVGGGGGVGLEAALCKPALSPPPPAPEFK